MLVHVRLVLRTQYERLLALIARVLRVTALLKSEHSIENCAAPTFTPKCTTFVCFFSCCFDSNDFAHTSHTAARFNSAKFKLTAARAARFCVEYAH